MAADSHFKYSSWTISGLFIESLNYVTNLDRFLRLIHQNACFWYMEVPFGF